MQSEYNKVVDKKIAVESVSKMTIRSNLTHHFVCWYVAYQNKVDKRQNFFISRAKNLY